MGYISRAHQYLGRKRVLVRGFVCSYSLPQEVINKVKTSEPSLIIEEQTMITPPPTTTPTPTSLLQVTATITVKEKETVTLTITTITIYTAPSTLSQSIPSPQQYSNGLLVEISLSIGIIVALVIHIIWRLKSKP